MPSESSNTAKVSLTSKTTESRYLAIGNLPETATEETVKEYFQRYGNVLSVKFNEQRFAFVAFSNVRSASKAHYAENLLDDQLLRTAFHDGTTCVPKILLDPPSTSNSNGTSSTLLPSSSSSSLTSAEVTATLTSVPMETSYSASSPNPSTMNSLTNSLTSKTINGDREKRSSRTHASPDDNVRHQVVPVKRDSDSSGSKRKATSSNLSKNSSTVHPTVQKPSHRKHEKSSSPSPSSSSSDSERSSDDSVSCKTRRRHPPKTHSTLNDSMRKTRVLKIYHLPPKMPRDSLRGSLWDLFVEFKKSCRLLTVKIEGENESRFALLTFSKPEDVEKALMFVSSKSINGTRLKAEPYDASTPETEDHEPIKRSICTDQDADEYSAKATRTLYIGNLQSEISYNELRETYSAYGDIIELEIKRQTQSQHQLPFAFVQYADIKSVVRAMKAFEPKLSRDHPIKLGFGKSQPTNVLWLDELPPNMSEGVLRTFIIRWTNLMAEQVLDIYIDNRNSHKTQAAQCLIYFSDTRAAQEAINLIRGKKVEGKRIQVDFASKVFVTRFSDIIEEASHKKNYGGFSSDPPYHNETRPVTKRNGTARDIAPDSIQPFDASSTRSNPNDRWANAYNNSNRISHKNESRYPSDRRYSKEYGKGASNSLISIPSIDNGTIPGSSSTSRRHRLSTSSRDSLSNNFSSGRSTKRTGRSRRAVSTSSSSSSRSSSTSSQSSSSSNSVEHRTNSYQKHSTEKASSKKSSSKPSKASTNNATTNTNNNTKALKKKSSTSKEPSSKSSHRSRTGKSDKDDEPSTTATAAPATSTSQQAEPIVLPTLTPEDQFESMKKEASPPKQSLTLHSSSSPKAPLKNTERVFDWLMQNHHQDSNSSIGLDQNDDDESTSKRKTDEDSLENVSDDPTSKASPPLQSNSSTTSATRTLNVSSSNPKHSKNEKSSLGSSYRLQPIRLGQKRDEQGENATPGNETHLPPSSSPPPPPPPLQPAPSAASSLLATAQPTPSTPSAVVAPPQPSTPSLTTPITPLSASLPSQPVHKEENEQNSVNRRPIKAKNTLSTGQTKIIPLESQSSYDQLDVRLKSYPSLFNDHTEALRLPFPQFAFEYLKNSTAPSTVLVVLNPKAHLKHSSLGLNNPSTNKSEPSIDTHSSVSTVSASTTATTTTTTTLTTSSLLINSNNDDDLSTARIPLDERIRLLDNQLHEMNQGQQKSIASSSSSSSSASLSPATLIEQTQKTSILTAANSSTSVKTVNDLVSSLSSATSSATLNHCLQAARAAISAQPTLSTPTAKPSLPSLSTPSPFTFPVTAVSALNPNRTLPVTPTPSVTISSVLMTPPLPPPPPPPPPPFPSLRRLSDSTPNSILNDIQAALAQTQMVAAAAAKYTPLPFPNALHPPPPPVPASLISPSLNLNPAPTTPTLPPTSTNPLISTLTCPPSLAPPSIPTVPSTIHSLSSSSSSSSSSAPSVPTRSNMTDLLSPSIPNLPPTPSSLSDVNSQSPSTSSAKIVERLGPCAKVKRKPIPPPLVVVTTSNTSTSSSTGKDSSVLPSPDPHTPTTTGSNVHHSPVTVSSPTLQHQTSNSSTGLKSILKQRSLSNSSSVSPTNERQSPTGERKLSTNYVSPLASNESRSTNTVAPAKNRSGSIDSTTTTTSAAPATVAKRTPPSTPTNTKKNSTTASDNHVFSNDIDERHGDEKKSTWRALPSKQTTTESTIQKKPILDKIPKKSTATTGASTATATTPKPVGSTVEAAKTNAISTNTPKAVKPATKPAPSTPVSSKTSQSNTERVETKTAKTSTESSTKSTPKPTKIKRANILHSDSDSEKKTPPPPTPSSNNNNNVQKTKKPLTASEVLKQKQQQQQQQQKSTPIKKSPVVKTKSKARTRESAHEINSSASEIDERKADTTPTHSDQDQDSSEEEEKPSKKLMKNRTKTLNKSKEKNRKSVNNRKDARPGSSMYDLVKKRPRNEQTRQRSVSASEDHGSDENSDDDDDDDDSDDNRRDDDDDDDEDNHEEEDDRRKPHRSNHVGSKSNKLPSDSSDSEDERYSKKKNKNENTYDNNIFDDGDSDEKSKPPPAPVKKKVEPPAKPMVKKTVTKKNNEPSKKEPVAPVKSSNTESTAAKKKVPVMKPTEKKKPMVTTPKPISKIIKSTNAAQKRPSTDEPNETTKKMKTNDEKSKAMPKEDVTPAVSRSEPTTTVTEKPAIVVTSPTKETPAKSDDASTTTTAAAPESTTPSTPSKFGIVFTSHRRQSSTATSPSAGATSATVTNVTMDASTSHDESKNDAEEMEDDSEAHPTLSKDESLSSNMNTLRPPTNIVPPALSDDETLNPETMQLSDLIGGNRREEAQPAPTRSTGKTAAKGKRAAKQETTSNKRQQVKSNAKSARTPVTEEKETEPPVPTVAEPTPTPPPPVEPPAPVITSVKRLSTNESVTASSSDHEKEAKRLRPSTDEPAVVIKAEPMAPVKAEPMVAVEPEPAETIPEPLPQAQVKEEAHEAVVVPPAIEPKEPQASVTPASAPAPTPASTPASAPPTVAVLVPEPTAQVTSMETDPIPPPSSIIAANQSPPSTSPETETAIKAVVSSIQIPAPTVTKLPNLEKSTPIIAPISKETLPIVEHQTAPITTTSILPTHVSIKSSLPPSGFNENVEETLSAVNSLLMLNNNPPNPSGDHQALKGTARVTPTISQPVYSVVTSFPSPTSSPSRPTTLPSVPAPTTTISTPTNQSAKLITMVSNIVLSSSLNTDKQPATIATPVTTPSTSRTHIEEVIEDVAKGGLSVAPTVASVPVPSASVPPTPVPTTVPLVPTPSTTTIIPEPAITVVDTNSVSSVTSTAAPTKPTAIPPVLRDVMKTPCLTTTTAPATITAPTTTTTVTSETLNLFDSHRRSTSPLKTTTNTTTTTNVSTTIASSTPVVPSVARPPVSKTPTSHKRSSTPKTEPTPSVPSSMLNQLNQMLSSEGSFYAAAAAAAHHPSFPFPLFGPLTSNPNNPSVNPSSNLLPTSLLSNSPPLPARTSSANNPNVSSASHLMSNPFVNTIMSGQQPSLSSNVSHSHEKSRRESSAKGSGNSGSSSSSNRSTPIQQPVPVPIPLNIPSSTSGPGVNSQQQKQQQQQQQQQSALLTGLDPAAAAALRQQASPLQPFLGPDTVVPFRNVYGDPPELYGTPPGLYPPQDMAFAAARHMLTAMGIPGSHHPSAAAAALAELYSNHEPYFRLNPPSSELSRDPYNVQWQGNLILKNDQAYVKTQLVAGSPQIARASMNYWNSDAPCSNSSNLQTPSHHNLRISQRMRLEQAQLEGVQKRMQMETDHCILIAEPNGSTPDEIRIQQNNLKNGVIRYFDEKKAAGIVNVLLPGASQPAYVVHIFPPCQFASEILQKRAPDTYRCVVQNKIEQIYLLIVITSTVQ